jgi:hypothetical protein
MPNAPNSESPSRQFNSKFSHWESGLWTLTRCLIALSVTGTLCYMLAVKEKDGLLGSFTNIAFLVIGYFFGSSRISSGAE